MITYNNLKFDIFLFMYIILTCVFIYEEYEHYKKYNSHKLLNIALIFSYITLSIFTILDMNSRYIMYKI